MSGSPTMEPTAYDASIPIAVQAQENKRRKRRIMKIAVYVMFGIIALGVFAIWLFHKDSVESIRFNANFVFTVKVQTLEIKTDDQEGLLYGELGRNIKAAPFSSCWDADAKAYEPNCLYWKHKAYLRVSHDDNVTGSCYTLSWQGLQSGFIAEDCFYLQQYNWYGYLLPDEEFWPIQGIQVGKHGIIYEAGAAIVHLTTIQIDEVPYYSRYPEQQQVNLVPTWFGSQGIAIFVHSSYPFTISWNNTEKRQFCITSELEVLEDRTEEEGGVDQLSYTICKGKDLKDVYYNAQKHRHSWEAELKKTPHTIEPLLWPLHAVMSRDDIVPLFAALRSNRSRCSFLLLPEEWETRFGDMQFDQLLLQELRGLMSVTKETGCGCVLPISTFFTFNSRLFEEGIENGYFLRDELNLVTKMVRWRDREGAVLDATNPEAVHWYLDRVKLLLQNSSYNINALKLLHIDVPRDANFYDGNMTFLDYSRLFYRDASALLNVTLILEQATGFVSEPVFVSLRTEINDVHDAQCFNDTIPWALNLGISGYPLIIADGSELQKLPDVSVQLFQRWLQFAIFFPAFEIPNLPLLNNPDVVAYMNTLLNFRREIISYMKKQWTLENEAPILRSMWWRNPMDSTAQLISDQFFVGDELLVAPILCHPASERTIYVPPGKWETVRLDNNKTLIFDGPKTVRASVFGARLLIAFWAKK
ncbi:myogenesis-regulating glycosidase-like isoform X2 [Littorina saxatilis]|uniref:Uncharacterized protein n=1 Tax=Littorina saxatilis TaxID=31220 RepID=A0AAN9GQ96_9CAEN